MFDWLEHSVEPTLLFECRVSNSSSQLAMERRLFEQASQVQYCPSLLMSLVVSHDCNTSVLLLHVQVCAQQQHAADKNMPSKDSSGLGSVFKLELEARHASASAAAGRMEAVPRERVRTFLVSQQLGGQEMQARLQKWRTRASDAARTYPSAWVTQLVLFVTGTILAWCCALRFSLMHVCALLQGLAMKLGATFQASIVPWGAAAAEITPMAADYEPGRAFCFLPLPGSNGLPCHVNGYFELSSNRCVPAAGAAACLGHACPT